MSEEEQGAGPAPQGEGPSGKDVRIRILLVGGLAIVMLVAGIVLLNQNPESEHEFVAAPQRCLDEWNDDEAAVTLGTHQYDVHSYNRVQVLTLTKDGSAEAPETEPSSLCAVLFASPALDPEVSAAVSVNLPTGWGGLDVLQPADRLAELQRQAQSEYNAELREDGMIEPL